MAEPTAPEVVALAMAKERMTGLPLTPGSPEALRDARAQAINKAIDEKGYGEGLKIAKGAQIDENAIKTKQEQVGSERDSATGVKIRTPGSAEESRYNEIGKEAGLAKKIVEKGIDDVSMTKEQKQKLYDEVFARARLRPQLAAEINAMTKAQRDEFARRILKDPRLVGHIRDNLQSLLDPNNNLIDNALAAKQDLVREQEDLKRDKQGDIDDVDRRRGIVDGQLAEFARPAGGAPGSKAAELDSLRAGKPTIEGEINTYKRQQRDAEDKINIYKLELESARRGIAGGRPVADITSDIARETLSLRSAEEEVSTRQAKLKKIEDLEAENKNLEDRKKELDKEKRDRTSEMNKIQTELTRRQREMQDAKALRESQEVDLVNGFKNIVGESVTELFNEQEAELLEAYKVEAERMKQESGDQNEKALADAFQERWLVDTPKERKRGFIGFRRKEEYRPIDPNKVDVDYRTILDVGQGPRVVMKNLLMSRKNPVTGVKYTGVEAEAVLTKEFVEKNQPELVTQLLSRRLLTRGIQAEDVHQIVNAKWGEGMITSAMERNNKFRTEVEKVMGAGVLNQPGFLEKFGREARKHPWWLALLLLGVGAWAVKAVGQSPSASMAA